MLKALAPKTKLYIIIGVIVLFAVLFFVVYKKGQKKGGVSVNLSGGNADTGGVLASESEIKQLASQIHQDLSGANFFASHDSGIYNRVLALSDADLSRLYNAFNLAYSEESGESLVNWVDDEYAVAGSQWAAFKAAMLTRFSKLNFM